MRCNKVGGDNHMAHGGCGGVMTIIGLKNNLNDKCDKCDYQSQIKGHMGPTHAHTS